MYLMLGFNFEYYRSDKFVKKEMFLQNIDNIHNVHYVIQQN